MYGHGLIPLHPLNEKFLIVVMLNKKMREKTLENKTVDCSIMTSFPQLPQIGPRHCTVRVDIDLQCSRYISNGKIITFPMNNFKYAI